MCGNYVSAGLAKHIQIRRNAVRMQGNADAGAGAPAWGRTKAAKRVRGAKNRQHGKQERTKVVNELLNEGERHVGQRAAASEQYGASSTLRHTCTHSSTRTRTAGRGQGRGGDRRRRESGVCRGGGSEGGQGRGSRGGQNSKQHKKQSKHAAAATRWTQDEGANKETIVQTKNNRWVITGDAPPTDCRFAVSLATP